MTRPYHHGNLAAALIAGALDELADGGLAEFSVAKVARRIGVSPGAPYRHFADRDEFLAEVAVVATAAMVRTLRQAVDDAEAGVDEQLAATAGAYARFKLERGVGMELTFAPQFRGSRFTALAEQSRALIDLLLPLAHVASGSTSWSVALDLLESHVAVAEGYAALQRQGGFSMLQLSIDDVAARATAASMILIRGRRASGSCQCR